MKNVGGRPRKGSLEEKKAIVDHYFVSNCAEDGSAMQKHGIYQQLAIFAQERGYGYEARDFSRDQAIRDYITSFVDAKQSCLPQDILPVFVPMDISLISEMSRDEIVEMLRDRDRYYKSLYESANATLQPFRAKIQAFEQATKDLSEQAAKSDRLAAENEALTKRLRCVTEENQYLRSYIKKHLLPEQAEAVLQSNKDPKTAVQQTLPYVTTNIAQQTMEDQELRTQAKKNVLSLNYESLFD